MNLGCTPELRTDFVQQIPVPGEFFSPLVDSLPIDNAGHVFVEGHRELGLTSVQLDNARYRCDAVEGRVERFRLDTSGERLGAKLFAPLVETALLGARGRDVADRQSETQNGDKP